MSRVAVLATLACLVHPLLSDDVTTPSHRPSEATLSPRVNRPISETTVTETTVTGTTVTGTTVTGTTGPDDLDSISLRLLVNTSLCMFDIFNAVRKEDIQDAICRIEERNGFLKHFCYSQSTKATFSKCATTTSDRDQYYRQYSLKQCGVDYVAFTRTCPDDPGFYQLCGNDGYRPIRGNDTSYCGKVLRACFLRKLNPTSLTLRGRPERRVEGRFGKFKERAEKKRAIYFSARSGRWINSGHSPIFQCENYETEKAKDTVKTKLRSGKKVATHKVCNNKCDIASCEDEAVCNNLTYGFYFEEQGKNGKSYASPSYDTFQMYKCFLNNASLNNASLNNDSLNNDSLHSQSQWDTTYLNGNRTIKIKARNRCYALPNNTIPYNYTCDIAAVDKPKKSKNHLDIAEVETEVRVTVPIYNFTRCSGQIVCENRLDQTNCTDTGKIGVTCTSTVNGYPIGVAHKVICGTSITASAMCKDGIDIECTNTSKTCHDHKHRLCDKVSDCADGTDETSPLCSKLFPDASCVRRVGDGVTSLSIPFSWINDGVRDCVGGEDEEYQLKVCGQGLTSRNVTTDTICKNVFMCRDGKTFVEVEELCKGPPRCDEEARVCEGVKPRPVLQTYTTAASAPNEKRVAHCLPGLQQLHDLQQLHGQTGGCSNDTFIYPDIDYFGIDNKFRLSIPKQGKVNCDVLYGENYVYTACAGKCHNSACPITQTPTYGSCPGPNQVGTLATTTSASGAEQYLTFFFKHAKHGGGLHNRVFICAATPSCVPYSAVCDLVDDCGDGSDEAGCTNQHRCDADHTRIPLTRVCDGVVDCRDMSDECNNRCGDQILSYTIYKISCWTIGILAVLANSIVITKNIITFRQCKTRTVLINKVMVMLIGVGDLLLGVYLLLVGIADMVQGDTYCENQHAWLTSPQCSALGVLSTLGSQLSLFAMTTLSLVRLYAVFKAKKIQTGVKRVDYLMVMAVGVVLVVLATALAVLPIPVMKKHEDFFVNGVLFEEDLELFSGINSKEKIINVIKGYHGFKVNRKDADKPTSLSWEVLDGMVHDMFSHDSNSVEVTTIRSKQGFYGNDGVCLFKYFVTPSDPQRSFVWATLTVNFTCFVVIVVSYSISFTLIQLASKAAERAKNKSSIVLRAGQAGSKTSNILEKNNRRRRRTLQRKIGGIILTDFVCWVPFIITCALHSGELIDASFTYSLFSVIILPINSIINPLLYDNTLSDQFSAAATKITKCVRRRLTSITIPTFYSSQGSEGSVTVHCEVDKKKVRLSLPDVARA